MDRVESHGMSGAGARGAGKLTGFFFLNYLRFLLKSLAGKVLLMNQTEWRKASRRNGVMEFMKRGQKSSITIKSLLLEGRDAKGLKSPN